MAIAFVQNVVSPSGSTASTTRANTWLSNTTSGNLIVLAIGIESTTTSVSSVTDSQGNIYFLAKRQSSASTASVEIWYAPNIIGGTTPTVTVTLSGSNRSGVHMYEYSGLATIAPLDVAIGSQFTTVTPDTGTLITNYNDELLFAAMTSRATVTVGSGYGDFLHLDYAGGVGSDSSIDAQDKIVSLGGSYNATFTNSVTGSAILATFIGAATTRSSRGDILYNHIKVGDGMSRSEVAN